MFSISDLNSQQREAAETLNGPLLILAGAGSGKTRTITYRIAHMVQNRGIAPGSILGITFTNKAAREMRQRVTQLLGRKLTSKITLSTFHSLGVKILRSEITKLGYQPQFSIYDTSDQMGIIRQAMKSYRADKKFDQKEILFQIGKLKNQGISATAYKNSHLFDPEDAYSLATEYAYNFYQDKLKFFNAIDFDDILSLTNMIFTNFPDVAEKYSQRFNYIMVDEYQDTNGVQFQMIKSLTSSHDNLAVVGDDDQSIYSFRGADISNILNFEKNFPGAKVVKLEENYRSTMPILELANVIIAKNKRRKKKRLWTQIASTQRPILWITGNSDHEAELVVSDIVKSYSEGVSLEDIAILYRSNNQARPLEDQLRINQIPYILIGGQKFYEKKEIKDLMAYLFVILNPHDQTALRRILNVPARGIGMVTLNRYLEKSEEDNISLFNALKKYPDLDPKRRVPIEKFTQLIVKYRTLFKEGDLPTCISSLVEEIDYKVFIDKQHDNIKQSDLRKNDVEMFISSAQSFARKYGTQATLQNFVEQLLLRDSQDNNSEKEQKSNNQVTLMTLHSSKGLEFKEVYLIGMEEELLPHKRSIQEGGEEIDEERRLCYVGITRAQQKLIMTYSKSREIYGQEVVRHPSRFIQEVRSKKLIDEEDKTSFSGMSEKDATKFKTDFFNDLIGSF